MIKNENPKQLLETEVINHLINNSEYFDIAFPLLEPDFFDYEYRVLYKHIENHFQKYARPPQLKELVISFKDSPDREKNVIRSKLSEFKSYEPMEMDFLLDQTEAFIKRKIFEKAIITGAEALGANDQDKFTESFRLAEESVKVTLDADLGIDIFDIKARYDDYLPQNGLKTLVKSFDKVIGDGYTPGTLHLIISPSGVGKSAMLSTFGVQFLKQKRDVVILSLEMAESQFYKRIDANLLDIPIYDLGKIPRERIENGYKRLDGSLGRLFVKEFPAGSLSPLGVDAYLEKLKNEKGIEDPIVMIDYLTLMKSDILRNGDNSYGYFKSVAEELRAVAQKRKLIFFTPMQSNRSSVNNVEADQSSISDSMAVYMTSDSAFMILQTKEMKESGEMKINFVKNRMSGKTFSFNIKYDYEHFRIIDKFFVEDESGGENLTAHEIKSDFDVDQFEDSLGGLLI